MEPVDPRMAASGLGKWAVEAGGEGIEACGRDEGDVSLSGRNEICDEQIFQLCPGTPIERIERGEKRRN